MPVLKRVRDRVAAHEWPQRVGEVRVVHPYHFGRGTVEADFRYQDGRIEVFQSWASKSPRDEATIVLPVTPKGEVIMLVNFCHAAGIPNIELPGGTPKAIGTPPLEVAKEELADETGYEADNLVYLGRSWWEPHNLAHPMHMVLALGCKKTGNINRETTEVMFIEVVTWQEWLDICHDADTDRDNKSLAVTFLSEPYLRAEGII